MAGQTIIDGKAVSVVVAVSSLSHAANVFFNYMQQNLKKKELILIHSNPADDFEQWVYFCTLYPMTRIYQLDEGVTLGECLNYCIDRSIFENIAIFDSGSYYGPEYLSFAVKERILHNAELAGQKSYFAEALDGSGSMLVNPGFESRFADVVILPTFVFNRTMFKGIMPEGVRFRNENDNLDLQFCEECRNHGFGIYSSKADKMQFRMKTQ